MTVNLVNAIRALSMDAVQQANSGHPGMPMGMADIATVLWQDFLQHNPTNPNWVNRDRFILSNGHGSMLHYSLLHLTGYALTIEDLKQFRQLHSKTPGHPELGYTPGVETTTGPLGQGLANAVGMALAEKILAATFNQENFPIVDHTTYVFMGDGCMMEGISHEVASLAGTLGLGKLIAFWDDNGISIDGKVHGWFTDDTPKRFEAYGWQVIKNIDGHDTDAVKKALKKARRELNKPTLICCKTIIGYGSPNKQGKEASHGAALGADEIKLTREKLGWNYPPFEIPQDIYDAWDAKASGKRQENKWNKLFKAYQEQYPQLAQEFLRRQNKILPENWLSTIQAAIQKAQTDKATIATRKASQEALNIMGPILPELLGGSADLAGSNLTIWKGSVGVAANNAKGNYIYYGVREFGMCAIANGIALHGGFIPYVATFLVFSDYARNAMRMAALMKQRVIYVFTHDSIGLGEDGPTHQPIEHLASLRLIPNMSLWRPCDVTETFIAWQCAIERLDGPTLLSLSRQNLPHMARTETQVQNIYRGGYILKEAANPELVIVATGSEVHLAMQAAEALTQRVQVVSMPSMDVFSKQDQAYQNNVLPKVPTLAIEAGSTHAWDRLLKGRPYEILGLDRFGESAPASDLFKFFGFTKENVVKLCCDLLNN
jgi:transketolase